MSSFSQSCERIFIKTHGIESRYVIGPENILFIGPENILFIGPENILFTGPENILFTGPENILFAGASVPLSAWKVHRLWQWNGGANSLSKLVYLRFFNKRLEPETLKMSDY